MKTYLKRIAEYEWYLDESNKFLKVGFFINTNLDCRMKHLENSKPAVAFFRGTELIFKMLEEDVTFDSLYRARALAILSNQKLWSSRVMSSIKLYDLNALVYIPDYETGIDKVDFEIFDKIDGASKIMRE